MAKMVHTPTSVRWPVDLAYISTPMRKKHMMEKAHFMTSGVAPAPRMVVLRRMQVANAGCEKAQTISRGVAMCKCSSLPPARMPTSCSRKITKHKPRKLITAMLSFQQKRTARTAISLEPAPRYCPVKAAAAVAIAKPGMKLIDSTRIAIMCAPRAPCIGNCEMVWMPK